MRYFTPKVMPPPQVGGSPASQIGQSLTQLGMMWLMSQKNPEEQFLEKARADLAKAQAEKLRSETEAVNLRTGAGRGLLEAATRGELRNERGALSDPALVMLLNAVGGDNLLPSTRAMLGNAEQDGFRQLALLTGQIPGATGYDAGTWQKAHEYSLAKERIRAGADIRVAELASQARSAGDPFSMMRTLANLEDVHRKLLNDVDNARKAMFKVENGFDDAASDAYYKIIQLLPALGIYGSSDVKRIGAIVTYMEVNGLPRTQETFLRLYNDKNFKPVEYASTVLDTRAKKIGEQVAAFTATNATRIEQIHAISKQLEMYRAAAQSMFGGSMQAPVQPQPEMPQPATPASPSQAPAPVATQTAPSAPPPSVPQVAVEPMEGPISAIERGQSVGRPLDPKNNADLEFAVRHVQSNLSFYRGRGKEETPIHGLFVVDDIIYQRLPNRQIRLIGKVGS